MIKLSALQMQSVPDIKQNLATIEELLASINVNGDHIVVLPEACLYFGSKDKLQLTIAEHLGDGFMQQQLSRLAKQYGVYLVAGSIPIKVATDEKFTASSLVYSPQGLLIADYQKLHLFDVDVDDSEKQYRESIHTEAGEKTTLVQIEEALLGLTICYDLRFPELYRSLATQGANVITVASAFTEVTGAAHWLPLLQARAIENQVYIIAANQYGEHLNGRKTFGHSVIINPWGEVEVIKETGKGVITTNFDLSFTNQVRTNIPVLKHNKFSVTLK